MGSPLIHEQAEPREQHTPSRLELVLAEQRQSLLGTLAGLDGNGCADGFDLSNHVWVVFLEVVDGAENFNGLAFAASLGQPRVWMSAWI